MLLTLIKKNKEAGDAVTYIFKPETKISWRAGQYLIYNLEHKNKDLRGKMRFFTISSAPFTKNISITTRIEKKHSSFKNALDKLKIGQIISAKGPDGDFVIENSNKSYVFFAGGIGITPFHAILKQLEHDKIDLKINLFYATKDNNVFFKDELDKLKLKNLSIKYLVDERITEKTIKSIPSYKNKMFYVSGPETMVEFLEKTLDKIGIPKKNQYFDYFSGYKKI